MGVTRVEVTLVVDSAEARLEVMVDTCANYSVFPRALLESLGVQPWHKVELQLADGSIIQRDLGEVRVHLDGRRMHIPVIFGEEGDPAVLGVTALETFSVTVDPINRRLVPTRAVWL
jgi:predicted aspartyl protease